MPRWKQNTRLFIQRFIFSHSKCHSPVGAHLITCFRENRNGSLRRASVALHTRSRKSIGSNYAGSENHTLSYVTVFTLCVMMLLLSSTHRNKNANENNENIYLSLNVHSIVAQFVEFIRISKLSPQNYTLNSVAGDGDLGQSLVHRNNIFGHIVNALAARTWSRANFINSHLLNEPITPQSSRWS